MANATLTKAEKAKNDEFYTQISDIEMELNHYRKHFAGKTILCNCDDPRVSNFFRYFALNFQTLGLKRLIATCYMNDNPDLFSQGSVNKSIYSDFDGSFRCNELTDFNRIPFKQLNGDGVYSAGDFRSKECIALLEQADIVVTNPPFSLFREYVAQLIKYNKKFVIIGNQNAVTYKEIFPLIKENKIWLGYKSGDMAFVVPDYYEARATRFWIDENGTKHRSLGNICWFTNLDITKRHVDLILYKKYNPEEYPKYDNYNAINVDKVANIPCDYDGVMGVPITFLDKYNPEQFEIVGCTESEGRGLSNGVFNGQSVVTQPLVGGAEFTSGYSSNLRVPGYGYYHRARIKGKEVYFRILIRNINPRINEQSERHDGKRKK